MLAILMLFCLAACGDESEVSEPESSVAEQKPVIPVINGVSLSEFTVVYKNNSGVAQQYRTVAESFTEYVKAKYELKLECVTDSAEETENEIIFGIVSGRDISKGKTKDYGYGGYTIAIDGTKVMFAASYATGANAGLKAFYEMIEASEDGVFGNMEISGEKDIIKVACVGDSITHGGNSVDKSKNYPAFLQEMLGLDYFVLNAGVSGYSICKTDQYAYCKDAAYERAKKLEPDVVLFALGTNDANPTPSQPYKDWDNPLNNRQDLFISSTNELIDSFIEINPDVQVIMILPASLFKVGNDQWNAEAWTANLEEHVLPLLRRIAKDRGLQTVEFFDWSIEHKEIFTDGLHPKDNSYRTYAEHIYEEIKDTIKKP